VGAWSALANAVGSMRRLSPEEHTKNHMGAHQINHLLGQHAHGPLPPPDERHAPPLDTPRMRRHLRLTAYSPPNRVHQPAWLLLREHPGEPPIPDTVARKPGGGMYGAEAKCEPCVTPVLAKGE
jgi:hypothetical protein